MHYYQFNIADYRKDTGHLTHEEHYIYRALIDEYYLNETPLSLDSRNLVRRLRLTSDQIPVLEQVLSDFFIESENGYIHDRIEKELARIYEKSDKARESANKRWGKNANALNKDANAMRTHSEGNANGMLPIDPIPNTQEENYARGKTSTKLPACPYQEIIKIYHERLPMLPKVVTLTEARKRAIKARWNGDADNLKFWEDYFDHVSKSKFLTGKVDPPPGRKQFVADIDFLIRESTIVKTQEGKYNG